MSPGGSRAERDVAAPPFATAIARRAVLAARAAGLAVACGIAVGAVVAGAEETVRKTEDVLSSVAGIARNLELADVPSPIDVTADRLEFDYNNGILRYSGDVRVEHAGAVIRARQIEIAFETEGKRALHKVTARGGVEVVRGDETAHGELAEYDPKAATIVLSQKARLGSGANSLSGERVVVYLDEGRAVVQGGATGGVTNEGRPDENSVSRDAATAPGRVRVVIMPDSVKPKGSKKSAATGRPVKEEKP